MSTYMAKAGQVDRKWYVIDAAGKPLGRVAAPVSYTHLELGTVLKVNADLSDVVVTRCV